MVSFSALASKIFGTSNEKRLKRYYDTVASINAMEPEIARLTEWLAHAGAEQKFPHLDRMNQWVRERLRLSQAALDEAGIESALAKAALFPEADELHDPEGELPKGSYSFY